MILDSSALLAFLHDEPGGDRVRTALNGGLVCAVNWAEVVQKSLRRRVDVSGMREEFSEIGVVFEPFTPSQAEVAAHLWKNTRHHGLPLADRACLALALERMAPVLTADQVWCQLDLGIEVCPIR